MQSLLPERFKLAVHLETQVVGRVFHALSLATVLRERQQRRCEVSGEPFQELPAFPPGAKLRSITEILRNGRLRAYERSLSLRDGAGAAEIATDSGNNAYHPPLRVGISAHRTLDDQVISGIKKERAAGTDARSQRVSEAPESERGPHTEIAPPT
jgi:hypothetical protein